MFYTSIVLVLPLVIIVVLNSSLVRTLRASKRRMKRNSLGYSGQSEGDITVIMVVIVVALVICHTPDRIVEVRIHTHTHTYTILMTIRMCRYISG